MRKAARQAEVQREAEKTITGRCEVTSRSECVFQAVGRLSLVWRLSQIVIGGEEEKDAVS